MNKKDKNNNSTSDKFVDLRNKAEEMVSEPEIDLEELSWEKIRKMIHELRVHQYELELQNEELRRTQNELEISRESYFGLYELAPMGYFTVGKNDQVLSLNLTAADLLDGDRGEFEQKGFSPLIHPDDLKIYYSHRKKVLDTRARQRCELRMKKQNDTFTYARLNIGLLHDFETGDNCLLITVIDITELKETERELMQLYTAVRNTSDSIIFTDSEGHITYVNNATYNIFENPVNKDFFELLDPRDHRKAKITLSQLRQKESMTEEFYISREDNRAVESNMSAMKDNDKTIGFLITSRDISERKRAEQDLKKKLMKFKIEEGNLYLEGNFDKAIDAFKELINAGHSGLIISRTPREKLESQENINFDFGFDFWRIAGKGGDVSSSLSELESKIDNLPKKKAVLVDRLDYFISKNGFEETFDFIQNLSDTAYLKDLIVILILDPTTLAENSLALLKKETNEIEPSCMEEMSEDLRSILKYVYSQNKMGISPSYTDVCKGLNISKPTIRKKIQSLVDKDYLIERREGKHKRVDITEKTRGLFWK